MTQERFDTLWADYLEGECDAAGIAELEALFTGRPELLDQAVDLYEIHRALGFVHQEKDPSLFARSTLERIRSEREGFVGSLMGRLGGTAVPRRTPWIGYAAVAAATLVFSFFLHLLIGGSSSTQAPPSSPVATLVRIDQASWEPDAGLLEGQRLGAGPIRLSRGNAVLTFDGGAAVALYGPADFEIESRGSARLRQGRISVRAEQDAAGFTVHTPAGEAVDLGTEFVITVDASGTTEIHVQEGEVSWSRQPGKPPSQVVKSGQALRSEAKSGTEDRTIPFVAQSLDDYLRQLSRQALPIRPTALEDFAYGAGEWSPESAGGGSGWNGPWRLRRGLEMTGEPDRTSTLKILPDSLQGSWFPKKEPGGSLSLGPGNHVYLRELAEPIDLERDGVYYLSFLVRRESDAPPAARELPYFRLTLRSSLDYWGASISAGLPLSLRPTLEFQRRGSFVAPHVLRAGETTLWVLKIVAGRSRPDEVFLKVFRSGEAIPSLEPMPWSVLTGALSGDSQLDLVVVTGSGPATHVFGGLRVGRTWESVIRRD